MAEGEQHSPPALTRAAAENARLVRDIRNELSELSILAALADKRRAYESQSAALGVHVRSRSTDGVAAAALTSSRSVAPSPVEALAALTVSALATMITCELRIIVQSRHAHYVHTNIPHDLYFCFAGCATPAGGVSQLGSSASRRWKCRERRGTACARCSHWRKPRAN